MGIIKVGIKEYKSVLKDLEKTKASYEKVVGRTAGDFRRFAPGWVATEVLKVYNITAKEVKPNKYGQSAIGNLKVEGKTISDLSIIYRGRVLTPVRFGMSPKTPKRAYTLKAQFKKGDKRVLGKVERLTKKQKKNIGRNLTRQGTRNSPKSPIMLMPTGSSFIPFQRRSEDRKDIKVIKTISMPQMISNPKVEERIYASIEDKLGKRFNHHVNQLVR